MFKLHDKLEQDTLPIGPFSLSDVLLMNDARYPWIILVPRRNNITEIHQLDEQDQQQLMVESSFVSNKLANLVHADKMNVAALGNVVSQLHLHHVARYQSDETWPDPVWGKGQAIAYSEDEKTILQTQLRREFSSFLTDEH